MASAGSAVRSFKSSALRKLVRTPSFEEASARLQFVVEHGSRMGLLLGESGLGKTTVLENFAADLRRDACLTAMVNVAGLESEELLWSIAVKLQATVEHEWNMFQLWRAINDRFTELRFLREQAVILVDDAGLASNEVLLQLYRLAQSEAAGDARLSIILATTPAGAQRLGRRLLDLVDLRIELSAWSLDETRALVESGNEADAGGADRPLRFSTTAIERLHDLTAGTPRSIVRLAELARVAATAERADYVDAETVSSVHQELDLRSLTA